MRECVDLEKYRITVFTPTYNRAKLLERVYKSLAKQADLSFIWLVVDDGSEDGTDVAVQSMIEEALFPIEYIYQKNGGKHRAYNTAVKNCKTEFFLILDSDDYLIPSAIETLKRYFGDLKRTSVSGIIGNIMDGKTQKIIGSKMPDIKYASGNELYQKYGLSGDTCRLYKTEILKKFLFPEIDGEKFVSENVVFDKIDGLYKMRVISEVLYVCEYQSGGYSSNIYKVHLDNPIGYAISLRSSFTSAVTWKKRMSYLILYIMWCRKMNLKIELESVQEKVYAVLITPIIGLFLLMKYPRFFFLHFK